MPNPWDAGTAKLLADFGFEAIATSSAALAWTLGETRCDRRRYARRCDRACASARQGERACRSTAISRAATATTPAEVAETMRRTIDAGVAGCSIEDQDQSGDGLYPLDEALRRFSAAKEAVAKSGVGFRADRALRGDFSASIPIRSAKR